MKDIMQGKVEGKKEGEDLECNTSVPPKAEPENQRSKYSKPVDWDGWRETVIEAVRAANVQQSDAG